MSRMVAQGQWIESDAHPMAVTAGSNQWQGPERTYMLVARKQVTLIHCRDNMRSHTASERNHCSEHAKVVLVADEGPLELTP